MVCPPPRSDDELARRYRELGRESDREVLVERLLPLVRTVAGRYGGKGIDYEDLVQVGTVGLLKAIERFDPERGVRLSTYAYPNISGEIKRHFRDFGWSVRMPRELQELSARMGRESERLAGELGRSPTTAELAGALAAPVTKVAEAIDGARSYSAASLDAEQGGGTQPAATGSCDSGFERAEARITASGRAQRLCERDRVIVYLRFFEDRTQEEIARQVGLSQMHVSRLLRRSLDRMAAS